MLKLSNPAHHDQLVSYFKEKPLICVLPWCVTWLCDMVQKLPPGALVVELGTFAGGTTAAFARANPLAQIHTIDLNDFVKHFETCPEMLADIKRMAAGVEWEPQEIPLMQNLHLDAYPNVHRHTGHSRSLDLHQIDFAFVDASHSTEDVLLDLEYLWPRMKMGGLITGDDCDYADVYSAVVQFCRKYDTEYRIYSKCFAITKKETGRTAGERVSAALSYQKPGW